MDFYGILFDMKNGKKIPYSKNYFDTLFAAKLEELGVKTITGTLPIEFTSKGGAIQWTVYGNNTPHNYSAEGTLPLTFTSHTAGNADDWSISGNNNVGENLVENIEQGSWSVSGFVKSDATTRCRIGNIIDVVGSQQYTMHLECPSHTGLLNIQFKTDDGISKGETGWQSVGEGGSYTMTIPSDATKITIILAIDAGAGNCTPANFTNVMLVKGSTAPDHYIPYQLGVGERTENLLPYVNGTYTHNRMTVTCNNGRYVIDIAEGTGGSVYTIPLPEFKIPVCQAQGGNGVLLLLNSTASYTMNVTLKNGSSAITDNLAIAPANRVITNYSSNTSEVLCDGLQIYCGNISGTAHMELSPMLVNTAQAPSTYIPYGYQIPITVSQDGQTDKNYDIYIGDSPLTAGQSISKTSTGVDIAAIAGTNTITTELYNKPEMSIEGVDYVGVGRPRGQEWEIRLVCVGELSPYKPNAPESDTSYVYNATDYTLDTDSRYKTALIDIGKEHQKIFTIGKTKGETFTIQPLDYMAEWGGVDHYNQIGQTITPTEETYTGETAAQYLLVTYYDSEVDTLTPKEIRESITLTATVDAHTIIPIDAPLTEGQSVSKESTGVDIETFPHAVNTLMEYAIEYSNIEMSITYKGG